jgi:hypothetical protein
MEEDPLFEVSVDEDNVVRVRIPGDAAVGTIMGYRNALDDVHACMFTTSTEDIGDPIKDSIFHRSAEKMGIGSIDDLRILLQLLAIRVVGGDSPKDIAHTQMDLSHN